jgi:hypothetical protein
MSKSLLMAALAATGLVVGSTATGFAHHSVQNQFDVSVLLEKRGVLDKVDWINPHAWFHFKEIDKDGKPVLGPDGTQVRWSIETTGPAGLVRAGLADRRLFKEGDIYGFSGYPARTYDPKTGKGDTSMFTNAITFPDGKTLGIATFQPGQQVPGT